MIILGIETSCDETGIAIYDKFSGIVCKYTYSQKIHYVYGGTVPELASNDHLKKIFKLIFLTLKLKKILIKDISLISYTIGPGLKSSLFIGILVGKTLSLALAIPSLGVNHLKAHIMISFLFNKKIEFPSLVLLLSGAHTFMIEINNFDVFFILGRTLDDSIGETFDKIARCLKLIPANGKTLEYMSKKNFLISNLGYFNSCYFSTNLNFSFSGIKSSVIRYINSNKYITHDDICNISYNFQATIIRLICIKCLSLFSVKKYKCLLLCGGVAANFYLRKSLKNYVYIFDIKFCTQPNEYCTDNGVMISFLGFIYFNKNVFDYNFNVMVKPNIGFNI
ncbi:MAG TPA: tRNA (adenosine(37)-N6)-threonylcarbamoyltransferase complex transferase subunit TsaD [Candidatus Azoamicus sp.]